MKKKRKRRSSIHVFAIALLSITLIGGAGFGTYKILHTTSPIDTTLSDWAIAAAIDPSYIETNGEFAHSSADGDRHYSLGTMYRGDFNNDGYEDAVVVSSECAVSCGTDINFVLNQKNGTGALAKGVSFPPEFEFSGAAQTNVTNITVRNNIIAITADNFCDGASEDDCIASDTPPSPKTENFKLVGTVLVKIP
jgi:hypothetical protein